jgi:hypothetical protein
VSCSNPEVFWAAALRELAVRFDAPPQRVLQEGPAGDPDAEVWLPGARLNVAAAALACPRAPAGAPAIVWAAEGRPRDVALLSREELQRRCMHVASCVAARWKPGARCAATLVGGCRRALSRHMSCCQDVTNPTPHIHTTPTNKCQHHARHGHRHQHAHDR